MATTQPQRSLPEASPHHDSGMLPGDRSWWRALGREIRHVHRRSVVIGALAAAGLAAAFVGVVAGTAGWQHLNTQVASDWWLLFPLLAGFGTQVTLMVELRHRHRLMQAAAVSVGAGAGVSGVGMVACCAHHLADLAPLAGATGVATFLTDAQRPLMLGGLALNVLAVAYAVRLIYRTPVTSEAGASCGH